MPKENPFIKPNESYVRHITPIKDYIEQSALYLSKMRDIPIDKAVAYIKQSIATKKFPNIRNPDVVYLHRGDNGDRQECVTSLTDYIKDTIRNEEIMAPTLTTYISDTKKKSVLAIFIEGNIVKRNIAKKAMFAAKAKNDETGTMNEDGKQRNFKLANNSVSGTHASSSNPLYNPSSHSTLTSNCRVTSAFGNANNEKLLAGNRHYWTVDIVLNNITSIITHTDYKLFQSVIDKYGLYLPDTEDIMEMVEYSTNLYWHEPRELNRVRQYVDRLTALEKAAFLYTGDLWHIKKHNPEFLKVFINKLSMRVDHTDSDPMSIIKDTADDILALAHQICSEQMQGKGKDYKAIEGTPELSMLAATCDNIANTLLEYKDFIEAIMVSDNVPASLSYFPNSIRRAALTSDTDSTIFTVQEWVFWLNDNIWHDRKAIAYGATMIFIASQAIIHILARFSANAGISKRNLRRIAMKNEFYFPVFIPTSVNKHYYASISCQEGNVYSKVKREIKGVHLKNSNTPKFIIKAAEDMMNSIMDTVMSGQKLSVMDYILRVADIERQIYNGVLSGDPQFFRSGVIKQPNSYNAEPARSPYFHYMLWNRVFADKYGVIAEPPYDVIQVSTMLDKTTKLKEYLEGLPDKTFANNLAAFLQEHGKTALATIQLPTSVILSKGIPSELHSVINARSIVINLSKIFYLILETLGFSMLNEKHTCLVSDYY